MAFTQEQVSRFTYDREPLVSEKDGKPYYPKDVRWDSKLKGFGVRVLPSGRKSWVLKYRNTDGTARFMTLDDTEALGAKDAHKRALAELAKVNSAEPVDPLQARQDARKRPTVAQLAEMYEAEHLPKKRGRSQVTDKAMIKRWILPEVGSDRVADVTRRDIERLHHGMAHYPTQANRVLSLLSKMFSRAVEWDYRPNNPAKGIERFPEESRQRYLTTDELQRLSEALDIHRHDYAPAVAIIRLCLLTGARSGEVMAARWTEFNLDTGHWTKPSAHTKQKRVHQVPLSAPALEVLSKIPRRGEFVFPGSGKTGHITTIKRSWNTIREAAELEDVVLHDLRHSYATLLASGGASLPMIGRLLGHTQPSTTARYAHLMDDPLRAVTERAGAIVSGGKRAPVVELKR